MADTAERRHAAVEESDVDPRFPTAVGVGALLVVVLCLVLALYLLHNPWVEPEVPAPSMLNPAPQAAEHLRVEPINRLIALRAAADKRLHSYGWVDQKAGIVHIPIERAMQLVVRRHAASESEASPAGHEGSP